MDKELGKIKKSYMDTAIVAKIEQEYGQSVIKISEYITGDRTTGYIKNFVSIPEKKWSEFLNMVNKIKIPKTS